MSHLPSIDPEQFLPLDERGWSEEARRLASFLREIAQNLRRETTIRVYGSAAVGTNGTQRTSGAFRKTS